MDLSFLPRRIFDAINKININSISEIRLRNKSPILLNIEGNYLYLSIDGITNFKSLALECKKDDIDYVLEQITEHSIYAYNEQIRRGFITTKDGIRVGIAGKCVFDNDKINTITEISSLNVRIPHEIKGCADKIYSLLFENKNLQNTLVVSPPGYGKTTLLKDITRKLNDLSNCSILIIDERGEFSRINGEKIDVISYSDKLFAFNYGIRSLSPNIIITDELITKNDWFCCKTATTSGVKIIASCHACSYEDLVKKDYFNKDIFSRFIIIEGSGAVGHIKAVLNEKGEIL